MKEIFTKWFSNIDKSGDETRLNNRIELIEEVAEDEEAPSLYDFFHFVAIDSNSNQELINYLVKKIQENEEEGFVPGKSEIIILSYGVLLYYTTKGARNEIFKMAYLLRIQGYKKSISPMMDDLISLAAPLPEQKCVSDRKHTYNSDLLEKELKALEPSMSGNIGAQGQPIFKVLKTLQRDIQHLSYDLSRVREENQLLWWLKSKFLTSLSIKIEELLPANRIICAAHDIMALSCRYWPPIPSREFIMEAYLQGAGKKPKLISFKNILENLTNYQAEKILGSFNDEQTSFKNLLTVMTSLQEAYLISKTKGSAKIKLTKPLQHLKENIPVENAIDIILSEIAIARLEILNG